MFQRSLLIIDFEVLTCTQILSCFNIFPKYFSPLERIYEVIKAVNGEEATILTGTWVRLYSKSK